MPALCSTSNITQKVCVWCSLSVHVYGAVYTKVVFTFLAMQARFSSAEFDICQEP